MKKDKIKNMGKNVKKNEIKVVEPKKITMILPMSVSEKLEKIAKKDYVSLEDMIEDYITRKIKTYDESGLSCDDCGGHIKENEEYFVNESSISKYEKIGDEIYEEKINSWSDNTLCMSCRNKQKQQDTPQIANVRKHSRAKDNKCIIKLEKINGVSK